MDLGDFKDWDPATQQRALRILQEKQESDWRPFYCPRPDCDGKPHETNDGWSFPHARESQRPPRTENYLTWANVGGRGCIAPWTRIDLPHGRTERVDLLADAGVAVQVRTPHGARMTDGPPFLKGEDHQWRFALTNGRDITVTGEHRFLTPDGWVAAAELDSGDALCAYHETNLVHIVAKVYSHFGEYYDLRVPGPDSYYASGVVNHNSGKTRSASEWVHRLAEKYPGSRIALISPTGPEVRETLIEGESGLLNTSPPGRMPEWEPSKKKLTWPNGTTATGYSGEEPDRLRGKQHSFGVLDEPAHMPLIEDVWSNFLFGLRLGQNPHVLCTTSPLPSKWLKELLTDEHTVVTRSTTYDNLDNLPPHFRKIILNRYEGTRLGRQEILGELLDEVEGALWTTEMIDENRTHTDPDLVRLVVGIDPAGTARKKSDETGIVLAGIDHDDHLHVLEDHSGRYSPEGWARKALDLAARTKADALVVEVTYGRDMVTSVLNNSKRASEVMPKIVTVDSRRGKELRAEPIVALYEKSKVHHHDPNHLEELETQQATWVPGKGNSPDRVDALVHALTHLAVKVAPSSICSPFDLLRSRGRSMRHGRLAS